MDATFRTGWVLTMTSGVRAFIFSMMIVMGCFSMAHAAVQQVDFGGLQWLEVKGKHFIVYIRSESDKALANIVLSRAESYYQDIGNLIGHTRYSDFWTWDDRAKIFVFADREEFSRVTGAPSWATGYSDRDSFLFKSRAVVTYRQEDAFYDSILPHEVAHLIVHDFIKREYLPIWLDEAVAQMYERRKHDAADRYCRALAQRGQTIRLDFLNRWDIRSETDAKKVELYYLQSLSVLRFLYREHGAYAFQRFFRELRDGKSVEEALRSAYPGKINSLDDLERHWINFLKRL
ncbi:MAG TPA: hypothetical protein P5246_03310 [Candidatus Omnitrophota bacterium]|jgi:hypothetical protein|nr:hypothetical protein [Candidatus Omnitrophota bacterium]HSA31911.1 hypothetical protein [Candidatus Omnitrophota bacterium]